MPVLQKEGYILKKRKYNSKSRIVESLILSSCLNKIYYIGSYLYDLEF